MIITKHSKSIFFLAGLLIIIGCSNKTDLIISYNNPHIDKQISIWVKNIVEEIVRRLGSGNVVSIILTGGFGKGEGSRKNHITR